jgi:hypothetical protein
MVKQDNEKIVDAFRKRLRENAGFAFIPEPLPMRNRANAVVYYLFLASPKLDFIHLRWRESTTIAAIWAFTMFLSCPLLDW